jgi:hypothetical protein
LEGPQESPIACPERLDGFCQPSILPHAVKAIVDRSPFLELLGRRRQYPIVNLTPATGGSKHADSPVLLIPAYLDQSATGKKFAAAADLIVLQPRLPAELKL